MEYMQSMLRLLFGMPAALLVFLVSCSPTAATAPEPKQPAPAVTKQPASSAKSDDPDPPFKPFAGQQGLVAGPDISAQYDYAGRLGNQLVVSLTLEAGWVQKAYAHSAEQRDKVLPDVMVHLNSEAADVEFVSIADSDPTAQQLLSSAGPPEPQDRVWLLLDESQISSVDMTLFANFSQGSPRGNLVQMRVKPQGQLPEVRPDAAATWGRALYRDLENYAFSSLALNFRTALHRLYGRSEGRRLDPVRSGRDRRGRTDLGDLMSLFTGHDSIEAALRYRTKQLAQGSPWLADIPLSELQLPSPRRHDWKRMLNGLSEQHPAPVLSQATPAEFYFVHAKSGEALFRLLDELSRWLSPLAQLLQPEGRSYEVSRRYQKMLGVAREPLSRTLGSQLIREVAVVGSDPFLRLGSDLTVVFAASNVAALRSALLESTKIASRGHGPLSSTELTIAGRTVTHTTTPDRAVSKFSVAEGERVYVSNSQNALLRVLETVDKKRPSLSNESDFRYMISRDDNSQHDVIAYAGDRFIEEIISPRARVLDARRTLAKAELQRVGQIGLLNSLLGGPITTDPHAMLKRDLLQKHELQHFDGTPISDGPRSEWGTPRHMIPIIDLPTPERVSESESVGYKKFVEHYNRAWGENLDPIALRLSIDENARGLHAHLRVLPIVNDSSYRLIQELVGNKRVRFRGSALGVQAVVGLSEKSELRRDLSDLSGYTLGAPIRFDWLGDYGFVGIEDRHSLTHVLQDLAPGADGIEGMSESQLLGRLDELPLYAGVHLHSTSGAQLLITALRSRLATELDLKFEEVGDHAGIPLHRVNAYGITVYFAIGKETLFLSLVERTLKKLIDLERAGQLPEATEQGRAQLALESRQKPGGGLSTVLGWLFETSATQGFDERTDDAQLIARTLHRTLDTGADLKSHQLGSLLGYHPVTTDGFHYENTAYGAVDPQRGSFIRTQFPELPVPGSSLDLLLGKLKLARFGIAFEAEAPGRDGLRESSLSVTVSIERDE